MPSFAPPFTLQLFLTADELWKEGVRPWVEEGRGRLEQSYIVVPTRGQVQGLKQRCVEEGLPLLGVEFLTPGLARRKWLAAQTEPPRPSMGRELLLLGLRRIVSERLSAADEQPETRGYWQSLQSDAERALDDWDALLRAGHSVSALKSPALRQLFTDLEHWMEQAGFVHAAKQDRELALTNTDSVDRLADRILVAGLGPEMGGEFYAVAGLVKRSGAATIWLPQPDFSGGPVRMQEEWVERWQETLEVDAQPSLVDDVSPGWERVSDLWVNDAATVPEVKDVEVLVGESREDEMILVAEQVQRWLQAGASRVGLIVPISNAGHMQLRQALGWANIPFVDLLEVAGPPPLEICLQKAILEYHAEGAQIESLMALWPRILAAGATRISQRKLRRIIERSFEACQQHDVASHQAIWRAQEPDLLKGLDALGAPWPEELTLADALKLFRSICEHLDIEEPAGIQSLDALGKIDNTSFPRSVAAEGISSVLADQIAASDGVSKSGFARVVLGSWRRLVGERWSHLIWTQSNATVWPTMASESPWWTDADRAELQAKKASDAGLMTAADQREVERAGWRRTVRDTSQAVVFSMARFEPEAPESLLAPNGWLERVIMAKGMLADGAAVSDVVAQLARIKSDALSGLPSAIEEWRDIGLNRLDPQRSFDAWFYGSSETPLRPEKLSPRLIERAIQDPAELWFEGILGARRIDRESLQRDRNRTLGLQAHEMVATAFQADQDIADGFGPMPTQAQVEEKLSHVFEHWRKQQKSDRYWRAFAAELEAVTKGLVGNVFGLDAGEFVATEQWLRGDAFLALPRHRVPLVGRMDLVRSDRPGWKEASIDIVDFKTGGDIAMSAKKMGANGRSLQLGIYLQAALSMGANSGRVWMVKSGPEEVSVMGHEELDTAFARLAWLDEALERGTYGALTPDRSDYSMGDYDWPQACQAIPQAILKRKFDLTFREQSEEDGG